MAYLEIEGGVPLKGKISISGAKNAALPMLAATILAGGGSFRLDNVPRLDDVKLFLELLTSLGCWVSWKEADSIVIDTDSIESCVAPYDLVNRMRASVLVLGPLVARLGRARVALPGGCAIGARPIDFHLKGLEAMGARLKLEKGFVEARASRLKGAHIFFDIPSVTGTENLMMAAVTARGRTVLENAAREPEIVALGEMLNQMGGQIHGLGSEKLVIDGVSSLNPVSFRTIPDRIEAGTYLMAPAVTGGELVVDQVNPEYLETVIGKLRLAGLDIDVDNSAIQVRKRGRINSIDITTQPYPGFPTDLQAQAMVMMSVASGLSVITETIFENRFMHVAELRRLGADIRIKGQSAIVKGVKRLQGAPVQATDLRASASLVLAGLAAKGTTTVTQLFHLDRGYENMEEKLASVGARIRRMEQQQV